MENREYRIGDKVIPKSKSVMGSLGSSIHWKLATDMGQSFLYIVRCNNEESRYSLSHLKTDTGGDNFLGKDLEPYVEYEAFGHPEDSKIVVINPTKELQKTVEGEVLYDALLEIKQKDIEFFNELDKLIKYLASTYSDKYESEESNYAKDRLLKEDGKPANIFTALKYIKRYDTVGFKKSENPQDILKSIHYLLFENQRKTKNGN